MFEKNPEREFCDYDLKGIIVVLGLAHNMRSLNYKLVGDIYNEEYIDLLLMLHYGSTQATHTSHAILNYNSIAKLLHKPVSTIASHCKLALKLRSS